MAIQRLDDEIGLTIFDRLLENTATSAGAGSKRTNTLVSSLRRDLEMLLNTRRQGELIPAEYEQCTRSVLNYGVVDLTRWGNLQVGSERTKLCRSLEEVIRVFEPRLRDVSLRLLENDEHSPVLRFRLEARAEVNAERVSFDMGLKRDSGEFSVLPR